MKGKGMVWFYLLVSMIEIICLVILFDKGSALNTDSVTVNEILWEVKNDWNSLNVHENNTNQQYSVIDNQGNVLYQSEAGISTSINEAIKRQDTILDIEIDDEIQGKLIVSNQLNQQYSRQLQNVALVVLIMIIIQSIMAIIYFIYLQRTIILPFIQMREFAQRVAYGNLDIPLTMDRKNAFGAFSEAFDIMRTEIKQARIAEAKANESKKELIAKLSHDIKTPLASIKAVAEVGAALTDDKNNTNYQQIIQKSDQIDTLVSDLFTASLEELQQLSVSVTKVSSTEIGPLLENADYQHVSQITEIPSCSINADVLRLQQVFDNIFVNSYKYAGTKIDVTATLSDKYLIIAIEDYGLGVNEKELAHLKDKYVRGSGTDKIEGAGLGLYIADYLMKMMKGALVIENGTNGFLVKVYLLIH
ncbi:MAG: HAMP domain-containing histidine kinase [Erysipelotrichaceae bacterium]|nr:HAMP domain-containing histidine kinase [Erysipelotrichaceae bacterium]